MAAYTKHPVAAAPAAPVREKTRHLLLRGWCVLILFLALSGVSWVNAFGDAVTVVVTLASAAASVVLWTVVRPLVQWRRLPWVPLAYLVWAALSIAWSQWPATSAVTLLLAVITTAQGLFVAAVLTWRELIAAIASAMKWCLALSLLFELYVAVVVRSPVMPEFAPHTHPVNAIVYWSRDLLLRGGRIQGIWGNANLLAIVSLMAIIVFALQYAARTPHRPLLIGWIVLAAYLLYRAGSATVYLSGIAAIIVLATALLIRGARTPGARTRWYLVFTAIGVVGAGTVWIFRDAVFTALGKSPDLTGRGRIWSAVLDRVSERPAFGWGFATPWLPWDPHLNRWIIDHGQSVMQAHNMWVDAMFQLGIVGVVLLSILFLTFIWRAWFFAVDRPRWDLQATRPYSALTLLPILTVAVLLVQGLAESEPLLLWGWMFLVMFSFKIKQAPIVGEASDDRSVAIEHGDLVAPSGRAARRAR